jgi:hypothetical protein
MDSIPRACAASAADALALAMAPRPHRGPVAPPQTSVIDYWDGEHLWIAPAEMGKRSSPYVGDSERKLADLGPNDSSARMLPPFSVLLSSRAPIGHLVISTEPMATNQGCKGLGPARTVDHAFLFYYIASIVGLLNELATGAAFKEISGTKLKEVPLPVPPLSEQKHIVAILDEDKAKSIPREVITLGRLQGAGKRAAQDIADHVLTYRNHKLAVVEAKRRDLPDTEGAGQAKTYVTKRQTRFAYSTNGLGIHRIDMITGAEQHVPEYQPPTSSGTGSSPRQTSGATASPRSPSRTRAASGRRATTRTSPSGGATVRA